MKKIITIGSATRDCIIQSNKVKVSESTPDKRGVRIPLGTKIELEDIILDSGGGGTNSAVTFARQGFAISCFSKVGDDPSGKEIIKGLKKENVDTSLIQKSKLHTAYSVVLLTPEGRSIFVYRGAAKDFNENIISENINSDWLYISSLGGNVNLLKEIIENAHAKGIKIAINPGTKEIKNQSTLLKLLPKITILILNRQEALNLTSEQNITDAFKKLNKNQITVITKGKEGAEAVYHKQRFKVGIFQEEKMVDRTGAGDAFGSGFVSGFIKSGQELNENCIKEALRLGSANSTSVIEHLGAKKKILSQEEYKSNNRWQNLPVEISKL